MRLFAAINFSEDIKDNICGISKKLKDSCISGNFSRRDNLHLTLLFMGEASPKQTALIKNAIDGIAFDSFSLTFDRIGKFGRGKEFLYWLGLKDSPALNTLARDIRNAVGRVFDIEDKKAFSPHITVARRAVPLAGFDEKALSGDIPHTAFTVDRISLMRSDRIDGKLVYTEIYAKNAAG